MSMLAICVVVCSSTHTLKFTGQSVNHIAKIGHIICIRESWSLIWTRYLKIRKPCSSFACTFSIYLIFEWIKKELSTTEPISRKSLAVSQTFYYIEINWKNCFIIFLFFFSHTKFTQQKATTESPKLKGSC